MHQTDIMTLYDYNYWATRRIVSAAANLTAEQFTAPTPLSWGSVRDVLTHVLGAEWVWRLRCQEGLAPAKLLDPTAFPTLDALLAHWGQEETAMRAYVGNLAEDALNSPIAYRNTAGKAFEAVLWQILLHVVNHGTQHRAEVAHVLTSLGHSPGDIDFIVYIREMQ